MPARPSIGRDLLDVPMGEMIREMAFAIADAQIKLDANSIEVAQMMGGLTTIKDPVTGGTTFSDSRVFFGKEKMLLGTACEVYNTTSDVSQKAQIKQVLDANSTTVEPANLIVVTANPNTTAPSGTIKDNPAYYYKWVDGTTTRIYDFDDSRTVGSKYVITTTPNYTYKAKAGSESNAVYVASRVSMLELGFAPTFYQFVDTIIEVKISISFKEEHGSEIGISHENKSTNVSGSFFPRRGTAGVTRNVSTTQVNANYSSKYSYSAEGSSLLRTKLVPIPPPSILEERIRAIMEIAREGK